jgi:hypothetical protein
MTQHEIPTHYGPEELGPEFRQPTSEELRMIEEGHALTDTSLPTSMRSQIGFQALHAPSEWGPAHHSEDYVRPEIPTPEGLNYSA